MSKLILKGPELQNTINTTLGEHYFNCAESFGDEICQIDARIDVSETYSSVKQRSTRTALEMQKRGINSEDVIGICTKITLDNIIPIIATFYLGAKVSNLDPSLSLKQITHLLSLVTPKMLFVEEASLSLIEESVTEANLTLEIVVFGPSDKYDTFENFLTPKTNEEDFKPMKVSLEDTAIIFFSSGTTSLPKAVCHSHYGFLYPVYSFYQTNCEFDVVLTFTSFYWLSALFTLTYLFMCGGRRIICDVNNIESVFHSIEKYNIRYLILPPILSYRLTDFEKNANYDTRSVYSVTMTGTPINHDQYLKLIDLFPESNIRFAYGLTEVSGLVTIFNSKIDSQFLKTKIGSCGRPIFGIQIKVVDLDSGEALGPKQKGEICVKTLSVMKGYYKADSSLSFDKEGFLKTGDFGYYDQDEYLYIVERLREMFKYKLWHIVPSLLEGVLLKHPSIKEAIIIGIPENQESEVPLACVVLKSNCEASKEEIEEFVATRVADHEKLRGGVIFLDSLLKTPSGKVMRKEIRKSVLDSM